MTRDKPIAPISLNLDYLKGYFKQHDPFFDFLFSGISPNSNYKNVHLYGFDFSVNFVFTPATTTALFSHREFSIFSIKKNTDTGLLLKFEYDFNFYGSFFFFPELSNFLKLFSENYHDKVVLTRFDIALDLPVSMDYFLKKGFKTQFKSTTEINKQKNIPQTLYLGNKGCSNKKYFFRVYDKIKDIEKKNKTMHYIDYYQYENVLRLELQINSQSVRYLDKNLLDLLNPVLVRDIFFSFAKNENGTYFKILDLLNLNFQNQKISIQGNPKLTKDADRLFNLLMRHIETFERLPYSERHANELKARVNDL